MTHNHIEPREFLESPNLVPTRLERVANFCKSLVRELWGGHSHVHTSCSNHVPQPEPDAALGFSACDPGLQVAVRAHEALVETRAEERNQKGVISSTTV
jgi:hypothetical protein